MNKHTPGPWIAKLGYVYSGDAGVCMCYGQNQTDAQLIAAAPDLLDAIKAVMAEIRGPNKPYSADSYLPNHLVGVITDAIAKATGVEE